MIDGSSTNYLFHLVGKNAKTYNGHFTDKQVTKIQKKSSTIKAAYRRMSLIVFVWKTIMSKIVTTDYNSAYIILQEMCTKYFF